MNTSHHESESKSHEAWSLGWSDKPPNHTSRRVFEKELQQFRRTGSMSEVRPNVSNHDLSWWISNGVPVIFSPFQALVGLSYGHSTPNSPEKSSLPSYNPSSCVACTRHSSSVKKLEAPVSKNVRLWVSGMSSDLTLPPILELLQSEGDRQLMHLLRRHQ
jgi:hypothetical protein